MRGNLRFAVFVFAAASCASSSAWADLVQNGGFETGDFTGWTVNPDANNTWRVESDFFGITPFAGSFFASDGCVNAACITGTPAQQSSLSQTLATTAGQAYNLNFRFTTGGNGVPNELDVLWNGSSVLDLGPGGTLGPINSYTLFSVPNLTATSNSTVLTFLGWQDPGWDGLDNVSVNPLPEPSVSILVGAAFFSLVWVAARRRRMREAS